MPSALARKPEESHAAPEPKQAPELSAEAEIGAPAGTPLFLRRWAGGPPPVQREETPEDLLQGEIEEEDEEEAAVQTKLEVNEPADAWEQEADQVAETAVQGPGSARAGVTPFRGPSVQRKCAACASGQKCSRCAEEEEEATAEAPAVQTKRRPGQSGPRSVPASAVRPPGPGEPLQDDVRERVEPLLGADLGQVRVHQGPAAHRQTADLGARAFTVGQDVWLGEGESSSNVGLMAHELAHVAQQRPGEVLRPPVQPRESPASKSPGYEQRPMKGGFKPGSPGAAPSPGIDARATRGVSEQHGVESRGAGTAPAVTGPAREGASETASPSPAAPAAAAGGSPGAVLEGLASAPPSQLATAVTQARTASDQEFTSERENLAANPPTMPRPSGLPRRTPGAEAPEPFEAPAPPEPESVEPEAVAPVELETTHVVSEAPLPAESPWETLFGASRGDDASLRTAAQTAVQSLPTDDPTVDTSAGPRPTVELVGEADPELMTGEMASQRTAADQSWIEARGEAAADYGENDIFPEVPEEILSARLTLSGGSAGRRREAAQAESAPDVAGAFDRAAAGRWQEEMAAARDENARAEQQRATDEEVEHGRAATEIARLESEAAGEQTAAQARAQGEVGSARTDWTAELTRADLEYTAESERLSTETRGQIATEQESTDRRARETLEQAEADAEAKATEARGQAEAKAAEAEAAEEESGGFLDWVGSAISSFIDGIRSAINAIFDALRAAVAWIIEQAKAAAVGIIELGRKAIVGLIRTFGTLLEAAAGILLAAFPEARRRAQERIRAAVSSAEEAVNAAADLLKAGVTAALDALGAALDFILEAYQKAYNLILDGIQALADLLLGLLEKIGNLVSAARQVPDHFEGQIQEELIGADLSKPLPFERTGPPAAQEALASAMTLEGEPVPAGDLAIREVAVDPVATLDLDPEFLATLDLPDGAEIDFGHNTDPANTLASLRDEALGLPPAGEEAEAAPAGEAVQGEAPAEADVVPGSEQDTENRLQEMMAAEPEGACSEGEPASEGGGGVPEEMKFGPLTQGQRARYLLSQMWNGIRQWWSCNWPTIVAATVAALLGIILLEIVTGGAITAALPVLLQILATVMIGVAVVRAASYVGEYLHKGWEGDIDGGGKSLARALAIGAVELVFAILFTLTGGALAALKAGAKAAMKLAGRGARAVGRGALAVGRGVAAGGRALARGAGKIARPVLQRGRAVMQGLSRGVAKGARSLDDLARRIGERLRFRGLKIKRRGKWLEVWGIINPEYLIAEVPVEQIEEALEAQDRAALLRQTLDEQGLITGRTIGAVGGKSAWTTSGFGRKVMDFYNDLRPSGLFAGVLDNPRSATRSVVEWTLENARKFGHQFEYLVDAVKDMKRLWTFSTDAERQLALFIPDARSIGVAYRVCHDCPRFFRVFAKIENRTLVIADPDWVYIFLRDGTSMKVSRFDLFGRLRSAQEILERFAYLEKTYP